MEEISCGWYGALTQHLASLRIHQQWYPGLGPSEQDHHHAGEGEDNQAGDDSPHQLVYTNGKHREGERLMGEDQDSELVTQTDKQTNQDSDILR